MAKQRYEMGIKTSMTDEKLQALANMDFEWSVRKEGQDALWNQRFEELQAFKEEHGHCRVPRNKPKLGLWAKKQRGERRASNSEERTIKLQEIGLYDK